MALYVWFTEKNGNSLRFREVPNESKQIFNYIRQELNDENEEWDFIIAPLEIFLNLNQTLNIKISDKSIYLNQILPHQSL